MKKYLLLRNNQESGPWTISELEAKNLLTSDLIWIENLSTAWSHPLEIDEIREAGIPVSKPRPRHIVTSRPVQQPQALGLDDPEFGIPQPQIALKERIQEYPQKAPVWGKNEGTISDIFRVAAVFGGLMIGAFLVKKAVDGFHFTPIAASNALPATVMFEEMPTATNYRNALLTEVVPAKDTVAKIVKKLKPKDIRKQLRIKGSEYKVGMLGGINGLQLKVYNASPHPVDKVTVAVQYLKPNGDVVHTDQYEVHSLRPRSTKLLEVPDSKRGVKVKYSIVEVHSKTYSKAIRQV